MWSWKIYWKRWKNKLSWANSVQEWLARQADAIFPSLEIIFLWCPIPMSCWTHYAISVILEHFIFFPFLDAYFEGQGVKITKYIFVQFSCHLKNNFVVQLSFPIRSIWKTFNFFHLKPSVFGPPLFYGREGSQMLSDFLANLANLEHFFSISSQHFWTPAMRGGGEGTGQKFPGGGGINSK